MTPDVMQGRVNATSRVLAGAAAPVGALLGGALGDGIGLRATLAVGGLGLPWLVSGSSCRRCVECIRRQRHSQSPTIGRWPVRIVRAVIRVNTPEELWRRAAGGTTKNEAVVSYSLGRSRRPRSGMHERRRLAGPLEGQRWAQSMD